MIKRYSKNLFQDLHSDLTRIWNPFCNPASQVTRFPVEFCALSWPDRKAELKLYTVAWLRTSLLPWSLKKTSKGRQGEPTKTQLVQKFQEVWFCWRMLIMDTHGTRWCRRPSGKCLSQASSVAPLLHTTSADCLLLTAPVGFHPCYCQSHHLEKQILSGECMNMAGWYWL